MTTPQERAGVDIFQKRNISHSAVFSSLSNDTRLRCLYLAARLGEVCVCEAVAALGVTQPTVSKAFRALKDAGLVEDRRDAKWTYYRLAKEMPGWLTATLETLFDDLDGRPAYRLDEQHVRKARAAGNCDNPATAPGGSASR